MTRQILHKCGTPVIAMVNDGRIALYCTKCNVLADITTNSPWERFGHEVSLGDEFKLYSKEGEK